MSIPAKHQSKRWPPLIELFLLPFLVLFLFAFCNPTIAQSDAAYVREIARQMQGQTEVAMYGGRADIVTENYAIEVEFARLWKQSIGQSLWYGMQLNKKPGIVLVMHTLEDRKYGVMLQSALDHADLQDKIRVWFYPEDFGGKLTNDPKDTDLPPLHDVGVNCLHWLNTGSDTRHNRRCSNFANTRNGRCATATEGRACGMCGG